MPKESFAAKLLVGIKQSRTAVLGGRAQKAYIAENADDGIKIPFCELCREHAVSIETVATKQQLGKMCGISVGAACAVVLKED